MYSGDLWSTYSIKAGVKISVKRKSPIIIIIIIMIITIQKCTDLFTAGTNSLNRESLI